MDLFFFSRNFRMLSNFLVIETSKLRVVLIVERNDPSFEAISGIPDFT